MSRVESRESKMDLSDEQLRLRLSFKVRYHLGASCTAVDQIVDRSLNALLQDERLPALATKEEVVSLLNTICHGMITDYQESRGERTTVARRAGKRAKNVLIVDDISNNRELIRDLLESCGYAVHEAKSGVDGIRLARELQPDLILLDLHMPGVDGFQVLKVLRGEHNFVGTPIVALTADTRSGVADEALSCGFTSYLPLPASLMALRAEVGRLLPN